MIVGVKITMEVPLGEVSKLSDKQMSGDVSFDTRNK